jgi:cell division ATPase FtsA
MLPAGIILTGGGSGIGPIKEIAESSLKLHSKIAQINIPSDAKIKDSTWAVAYGMTIWGLTGDSFARPAAGEAISDIGKSLGGFFKQFLP